MGVLTRFVLIVLLVSTAVSAHKHKHHGPDNTLGPIPAPHADFKNPKNIVPNRHVSLHYASNSTEDAVSSVNVTLSMKYPSVLLEEIASVISVVCSPSSVGVKFDSKAAYQKAVGSWPARGDFILVTNHFGDCDAEYERGLFTVDALAWNPSGLAVTATSSKSDIATLAEIGEFTFGKQTATSLSKRLTLDPSYTFSADLALPPATKIYSYSPYLTVTANTASFKSDIVFSGYLKYNFLLFKLQDLYFDIDTSFAADLEISAAITAAYNTTLVYKPNPLTYSLLNIPGILSISPEAIFSVGADVTASAAVDISTTFGIALADGNAHVDALKSSNSGTSGWTPTYTAVANISANAAATFDPYISLTVELAISVLSGLVDLSTGITAKPGFDNEFVFTGAEGVDLTGLSTVTPKGAGSCGNGLELQSKFNFELDAFVTQFYSTKLYSTEVSLLDECFSWAS